nr:hypothetical protein Iba_chr01aCG4910 [Ipomoea batatas]
MCRRCPSGKVVNSPSSTRLRAEVLELSFCPIVENIVEAWSSDCDVCNHGGTIAGAEAGRETRGGPGLVEQGLLRWQSRETDLGLAVGVLIFADLPRSSDVPPLPIGEKSSTRRRPPVEELRDKNYFVIRTKQSSGMVLIESVGQFLVNKFVSYIVELMGLSCETFFKHLTFGDKNDISIVEDPPVDNHIEKSDTRLYKLSLTQPPPVLDPHLFHPSIFVLLDGVGRNGSAGSEECWQTGSHWNGSIVVADSVGVRHWADFGVFNPADSGVSCTSSSSGLNPTLSSSSLPCLDFFVLLSNKSWSSGDRVVAVGVTVSESVSATVSILLL